ncbi:membrane protein [Tistrella bauzanensis]|uniref:Membrane protein n=1 Tax=Tistrella bauzanensis TaxID=657419 RepID=A0ABQ1IFU6_9PROT|nr:DUF924 family protein [Tistrella bauzanensis]GGB37592.1 membrane protein [Tistrella bauzanensis]
MITDIAAALHAEDVAAADPGAAGRVVDFWFGELGPDDWFGAGDALDDVIRDRFARVHAGAIRGVCAGWRVEPYGRLAEILLLDQFSRHIHRGTPRAFAADPMALALAQEAVARGHDQRLPPLHRQFVYLPFMHSESLLVHDQAVALYEALGDANALDFEYRHRDILRRFGRYPHRNAMLDRNTTPDEARFLTEPGSEF